MTDKMTVPLTLPVDVWGRLASNAENAGVTVADLIAEAIRPLAVTPPKRGRAGHQMHEERLAQIVRLRAQGFTWPQIAGQSGIPYNTVIAIAKKHGLTKPRQTKENAA